jgi:hypothetical protein
LKDLDDRFATVLRQEDDFPPELLNIKELTRHPTDAGSESKDFVV